MLKIMRVGALGDNNIDVHLSNGSIVLLCLIPFSIKISSGFAANAREALVVRGSPSEY